MKGEFFNPFPKYLQIRDILLRRFGREYRPGDRLPTEHEFIREFGVSRETIREALRGLEHDGLIRREQGRGTFVLRLPPGTDDRRHTGLTEDFAPLGLATDVAILETGPVVPPHDVAVALDVALDEPLFHIRRLRSLEGEPFSVHDSLMPLEVGEEVVRHDLFRMSPYQVMDRILGYSFYEEHHVIDATVADVELATQLTVPTGAPLLVVRRLAVVESLDVRLSFESTFRSDRYYYTLQLAPPRARQREAATGAKKPQRASSPRRPRARNSRTGVPRF